MAEGKKWGLEQRVLPGFNCVLACTADTCMHNAHLVPLMSMHCCLVGAEGNAYLVGCFGKAFASKGPWNAAGGGAGPFLGLCMLHGPQSLPVSLLPLVTRLAARYGPHLLH